MLPRRSYFLLFSQGLVGRVLLSGLFLLGAYTQGWARPQVSSLTPAHQASNVHPGALLRMVFNQAVLKGSGIIFIKNMSGQALFQLPVSSSAIVVSGAEVSILLPNTLPQGQEVYVKIEATCFRNANNDFFEGFHGENNWRFRIANQVLSLQSFSPERNAQCIGLNSPLQINFNLPVSKGQGFVYLFKENALKQSIAVSSSQVSILPGSQQVQIQLNEPLDGSSRYTVQIDSSAFRGAGTPAAPFIGIYNSDIWFFNTQNAPPEVQNGLSCGPGAVTLRAQGSSSSGGLLSYRWYASAEADIPLADNNGLVFTNSILNIPFVQSSTTYFVSVLSNNCESPRQAVEAIVAPVPVLVLQDTLLRIRAGESLRLEASGALQYQWQPSTGLSASNIANPIASPTSSITYLVRGTNEAGCSTSREVRIEVENFEREVFLPNLFSPNGDGRNDRFRVLGKNIVQIDFRVYNRQGLLLYQTQNVNEAMQEGWDGTFKGLLQSPDTYIWHLNGLFEDGTPLRFENKNSGSFILMR
jgi:gliding motility-associated-like protein